MSISQLSWITSLVRRARSMPLPPSTTWLALKPRPRLWTMYVRLSLPAPPPTRPGATTPTLPGKISKSVKTLSLPALPSADLRHPQVVAARAADHVDVQVGLGQQVAAHRGAEAVVAGA